MRTINVQKLSYQNFRKYGDYISMLKDDNFRTNSKSGRTNEFYPDLMQLSLGGDTLPSVSVCCVSRVDPAVVTSTEYHSHTCEGVLPLDADCVIYVAPAGRKYDPESVEAFLVPKGTFVRLNPGVYHGRQFVADTDLVHVMILLPQRTYANDCVNLRLSGNEQVEICIVE